MATSNSEDPIVGHISLKTTAAQVETEGILEWFETLNCPPFSDRVIWWQCQTAFKEAFDNVVEHAHRGLPPDTPIEVEAIRTARSLQIRLWDCGNACDLKHKLTELPDLTENMQDRGRGLHLINRIVDSWSYTRTDDNRNCLVMVKTFAAEGAEAAPTLTVEPG